MRRSNIRIIGVDENEDFQLKGPVNIFNKIIGKHNQLKEMNKTIQDLKVEIETIKKSQKETTVKIENIGKKSGAMMQASPTEYKR